MTLHWVGLDNFLTILYIDCWFSIFIEVRRCISCCLFPLVLAFSGHWLRSSSRILFDAISLFNSCWWVLARFDCIFFLNFRSSTKDSLEYKYFDILWRIEVVCFFSNDLDDNSNKISFHNCRSRIVMGRMGKYGWLIIVY